VRIALTRGLFATVDLVDADLQLFNWAAHRGKKTWYAIRSIERGPRGASKKTCFLLHRVIAERAGYAIDGIEFDHHDGDGLNCRRLNLRPASDEQNAQNCRKRSDNTSGVKGVHWDTARRKWVAQIVASGKYHTLGRFESKGVAASAYAVAAKELHGDFARTE